MCENSEVSEFLFKNMRRKASILNLLPEKSIKNAVFLKIAVCLF